MEKKPVTKGEAPGRGFPFSLLIIGLILQFIWYFTFFGRLGRSYPWMNTLLLAAAFILVLGIYNADTSPSVKMPYIILLLSLPLIGVPLFILIWTSPGTWLMKRRFAAITKQVLSRLDYQEASSAALCRADKNAYNLSEYIYRYSGYPLYHNTHITYFDNALSAFREQLEALKKARRFIFMEYHAIEDASSFQELHEILAAKVKEGVEVRLFYDEVGSLSFIDRRFIRKMEAGGIACRVFNPISPLLNLFLNHRDHRKITVIDGLVGFTGGYNLADEYFNIVQPYGHWKDTGLKITGPAVSNLTAAFFRGLERHPSHGYGGGRLPVPVLSQNRHRPKGVCQRGLCPALCRYASGWGNPGRKRIYPSHQYRQGLCLSDDSLSDHQLGNAGGPDPGGQKRRGCPDYHSRHPG